MGVALLSLAVPVILTALAPGAASRQLTALADWLRRHSRHSEIVLGLGFGTWLVVKGVAAL